VSPSLCSLFYSPARK